MEQRRSLRSEIDYESIYRSFECSALYTTALIRTSRMLFLSAVVELFGYPTRPLIFNEPKLNLPSTHSKRRLITSRLIEPFFIGPDMQSDVNHFVYHRVCRLLEPHLTCFKVTHYVLCEVYSTVFINYVLNAYNLVLAD